jgi:hypothetical protein
MGLGMAAVLLWRREETSVEFGEGNHDE